MNRKRIWGWWFFDWASQPYATLLLTFIFSIYFAEVAQHRLVAEGVDPAAAGAQAQAMWGWALSLAGVVIAVLAPILGAVADTTGRRMPWIWLFSGFYVVGAAGLWVLAPDGGMLVPALMFFGIGLIGMEFTTIFTNALMPTLTSREDMGRVSGSGFAFGYAGGVVSLIVMLALFAESATTGLTLIGQPPALGLDPALREGTRFVGPFTAIWYAVFMVPFFLWVREPAGAGRPLRLGVAMRDLGRLIADAVFFACGVAIGGAGGMMQAASRTMMVRHTTPDRATEAFGLYALSGKATSFLAPFLIATVTTATGSQRIGISPLIVMFLLALVLLVWVEPEGDPGP